MPRVIMPYVRENTHHFSSPRRRPTTTRRPLLERLETRVALSGLLNGDFSISHQSETRFGRSTTGSAAIRSNGATDLTRTVALQASLYAGPGSYITPVNTPLTPPNSEGLINAVTNNGVQGVYITVMGIPGVTQGTLSYPFYPPNTFGVFTYVPPSSTFSGMDSFAYQATNGTVYSNVGNVTVCVGCQGMVPTTPYYNYLRERRNIDPARFDFYHPRIGALLGMEDTGIPAAPTKIVSANKHFSVTASRSLYEENPQRYDQEQPVLGALFQLENPASDHESLLPQTEYYKEQRALYDSHPTQYQVKHVYLGAIFAIENFEQMD